MAGDGFLGITGPDEFLRITRVFCLQKFYNAEQGPRSLASTVLYSHDGRDPTAPVRVEGLLAINTLKDWGI